MDMLGNSSTSLHLQSAALLTFVLYFLCIHPEVTERLRQDILNEYGNDGIPTLERTQNLPYCELLLHNGFISVPHKSSFAVRAVIEESLRIFPPVSINMRYSTPSAQALPPYMSSEHGKGTFGPRYYVPPNTPILYNILLIQRRKDLWGEDAEIFRPERWLHYESSGDEDEAVAQVGDGARRLAKNPAMFAPFHMGTRLVRCIPPLSKKIISLIILYLTCSASDRTSHIMRCRTSSSGSCSASNHLSSPRTQCQQNQCLLLSGSWMTRRGWVGGLLNVCGPRPGLRRI